MNKSNKLIVIAGPTASGKTAKALKLAQKHDAEIFSADSRQLYLEMNIGVAKPSMAELDSAKHHFINHISVTQHYDVGIYEDEIIKSLDNYFINNETAILVGGTGLYIKAVTHGLDSFPDVNDKIVNELEKEFENNGLENLLEELKQKDTLSYNTLDLQNSRRVLRALGIIRQTGLPFSHFKSGERKERNFEIEYHYIDLERDILYERINKRVDIMLENGLEAEARSLLQLRKYKALETVGYQELFKYFDGEYNYNEAVEKIKQNSRNYAKRQVTWFKRFQP